jgi:hypothetical protein
VEGDGSNNTEGVVDDSGAHVKHKESDSSSGSSSSEAALELMSAPDNEIPMEAATQPALIQEIQMKKYVILLRRLSTHVACL